MSMNQYNDIGSENRIFRFTNDLEKEVYYLTDNTGVTASGIMNVIGFDRYEDILDAQDTYSMFVLSNAGTTLNITNVTIQNAAVGDRASAIDVVASDAVVNQITVMLYTMTELLILPIQPLMHKAVIFIIRRVS